MWGGEAFRHVSDIGTINEPLRYFAKRHTYLDQSEISPWNLQIILKTKRICIKIKKSIDRQKTYRGDRRFYKHTNLCMHVNDISRLIRCLKSNQDHGKLNR